MTLQDYRSLPTQINFYTTTRVKAPLRGFRKLSRVSSDASGLALSNHPDSQQLNSCVESLSTWSPLSTGILLNWDGKIHMNTCPTKVTHFLLFTFDNVFLLMFNLRQLLSTSIWFCKNVITSMCVVSTVTDQGWSSCNKSQNGCRKIQRFKSED